MTVHENQSLTHQGFVSSGGLDLGVGITKADGEIARFPGKTELLNDGDETTYRLVFDKGEEVMTGILAFVHERGLTAGSFTAIGAVCQAFIGVFDQEKKEYERVTLKEQSEVLALVGNLTLKDDQPFVHAHVILGFPGGLAHAGHLFAATVWPALEMTFTASNQHAQQVAQSNTGLLSLRH